MQYMLLPSIPRIFEVELKYFEIAFTRPVQQKWLSEMRKEELFIVPPRLEDIKRDNQKKILIERNYYKSKCEVRLKESTIYSTWI